MTTVKWAPFKSKGTELHNSLDLAYFDVEPVLPYIIKSRSRTNDKTYLSCPAFLEYYKNIYVVRSPINIKLTVNEDTKFLTMHTHNQEFYDEFIVNRNDTSDIKSPFLISVGVFYLFTSDTDCMMEQLPAHFHDDQVKNVRIIPGTFDISKWFRPVEFSFEVLDTSKPIEINRGDAMFYIRLVPKNGDKVKLQKTEFTETQLKAVSKCTALKIALDKQPLKVLYELAKPLRSLFKNKCPFNWRNK